MFIDKLEEHRCWYRCYTSSYDYFHFADVLFFCYVTCLGVMFNNPLLVYLIDILVFSVHVCVQRSSPGQGRVVGPQPFFFCSVRSSVLPFPFSLSSIGIYLFYGFSCQFTCIEIRKDTYPYLDYLGRRPCRVFVWVFVFPRVRDPLPRWSNYCLLTAQWDYWPEKIRGHFIHFYFNPPM